MKDDHLSPTLQSIVQLRWLALIVSISLFILAKIFLDSGLDYFGIALVSILLISTNYLVGRTPSPDYYSGILVIFDTFLMTVGLYYYGGYTNPFSMVYLVHVALAAFFLGYRWAWITFLLTSLCYTFIFYFYKPISILSMHGQHHTPGVAGFDLHLQGMLIAFLVIGFLLTYIVSKMSLELEQRQQKKSQQDRLFSLASVVAGAAHELSTPLGSALLISEELKTSSPSSEDVKDLVVELNKASKILHSLKARSPLHLGEGQVLTSVNEAVNEALVRFTDSERARVKVSASLTVNVKTLRSGLVESIATLIKNALEASPLESEVQVQLVSNSKNIRLLVSDLGPGVPSESLQHLGEPFFTTKEPGLGMGLGLFLLRSWADSAGVEVLLVNNYPGFKVQLIWARENN